LFGCGGAIVNAVGLHAEFRALDFSITTPGMTTDVPFISIWFGNFFEPFYSDREATRRGVAEVADLGFNSINLDSKAWEDFFARARGEAYRGQEASPYVAMHEFMMAEAARHGLDYTCLALYLCGDNLYPTIRDVPPVRGEESIRADGTPMGTYKYWSPRAQATMVEHVQNLVKLYGKGMRRQRGAPERIVMQTMFEPIPKPSFDDDGRQRYLSWLEKRYAGDVAAIGRRYQISAKSFTALKPAEYWLRPEELDWVGCARPSAEDFAKRTPEFFKWIDNQAYLAEELQRYLATMKRHWHAMEPPIFVEPVLHQWGYFFNPPGHPGWQTGQRALDVYQCADHVDGVLFIGAPLNAENRADAMALSVDAAIMRCANAGREFTGGLYLGRHVNADIYRVVPPAEAIATLVAAGASGLHIYGYSGLDDGGVMFRMDDGFKDSLRAANRWAAEVIPLVRDRPRQKQVAILFPAEMSLYEPLEVDEGGRHRMDLLGWYAQFIDLGWQVDILHPRQIAAGALAGYKHLVVPHNSLYDLGDNAAVEASVKQFVAAGGTMFHGPHCLLAQRAFGVEEEPIQFDCIRWHDEELIPHGWSTVSFRSGAALGTYIQSEKNAITQTSHGAGHVVSFGFQYGYSYSRSTMPIVPPNYGRREMHPIVLLRQTPIAALAGTPAELPIAPIRGVEFARFGDDRLVIVNHRATPVDVSGIKAAREHALLAAPPGSLSAHAAVMLEF
jgi:hypothetical protein